MRRERRGVNAAITAEWVWTVGTAVPVALVVWWLIFWYRKTWQRHIRKVHFRSMDAVMSELCLEARRRGTGWSISCGERKVFIHWHAGLLTYQTKLKTCIDGKKKTYVVPKLASSAWILERCERGENG